MNYPTSDSATFCWLWPSWWKGGIGKNSNTFGNLLNAFTCFSLFRLLIGKVTIVASMLCFFDLLLTFLPSIFPLYLFQFITFTLISFSTLLSSFALLALFFLLIVQVVLKRLTARWGWGWGSLRGSRSGTWKWRDVYTWQPWTVWRRSLSLETLNHLTPNVKFPL